MSLVSWKQRFCQQNEVCVKENYNDFSMAKMLFVNGKIERVNYWQDSNDAPQAHKYETRAISMTIK